MTSLTRRLFLQRASLGLAAVGGALALPRNAGAAAQAAPALRSQSHLQFDPPATHQKVSEPLVAYVRDASAGEVSLFIGTREVRFTDPNLVQALIQAAA
jgi:hypothetical protein